MYELDIQNNEYKIGTIWEYLSPEESETIKTYYDMLIKFKDNKELVTFLYPGVINHPLRKDSSYYTEQEFLELKKFVSNSKELEFEPNHQNKLIHDKLNVLYDQKTVEGIYLLLDTLCSRIINNLYKKSISPDDFQMKAQFTWYTEGDFINMHDDGPINTSSNRLCAVLIYLTPFELYNIGNGGELVLQSKKNVIDIVYPILGNFTVIDFTKNSPKHGVHKVIGDFNRFAYLHFVILNKNVI
jgi:Rps23 Pro-64 3,4-dihydroxylase Tpa1-like proline 4-hydroxylase